MPCAQRLPEASRSQAPALGIGTRQGSTATISFSASSRRRAPRVSTSSALLDRSARREGPQHAPRGGFGQQEERGERAHLDQRLGLQRAIAEHDRRDHPEQAAACERAQQPGHDASRRRQHGDVGRERGALRRPARLPHRARRQRADQRDAKASSARKASAAPPTQSPQATLSVRGGSPTGTSPITSVRSPRREPAITLPVASITAL